MTLSHRINQAFPVVWQDPHTLQIGIDPPVVVVPDIEDRFLPIVHHLRSGMSTQGLDMVAKQCRVTPNELNHFLSQLSPTLTQGPDPWAPPLALCFAGPTSTVLSQTLTSLGHRCLDITDSADLSSIDVVLICDYVLDPAWYHTWVRRDGPHTPIVFLDQSIQIGPRIVPGLTPCLHCLRAKRVRENPSTTAIESQLWGMRSPLRREAWEARAAFLLSDFLRVSLPGEWWRIDASSFAVRSQTLEPDESCDCRGL